MKRACTLLLMLVLLGPSAPAKGSAAMADAALLPLIPTPQAWHPAGGRLVLDDLARIVISGDDAAAARQAPLLVDGGGSRPSAARCRCRSRAPVRRRPDRCSWC